MVILNVYVGNMADRHSHIAAVLEELRRLPAQRDHFDATERQLIEEARDLGETWESLADAVGRGSEQAMQQRYRRIGGQRTWPTRRPNDAAANRTVDTLASLDTGRMRLLAAWFGADNLLSAYNQNTWCTDNPDNPKGSGVLAHPEDRQLAAEFNLRMVEVANHYTDGMQIEEAQETLASLEAIWNTPRRNIRAEFAEAWARNFPQTEPTRQEGDRAITVGASLDLSERDVIAIVSVLPSAQFATFTVTGLHGDGGSGVFVYTIDIDGTPAVLAAKEGCFETGRAYTEPLIRPNGDGVYNNHRVDYMALPRF